jgi:16S rRNA (cytosine967-C5)-methyltransferase
MKEAEANWREAVELLCAWQRGSGHLDDLLEQSGLAGSRWLVMETFRQWLVIEDLIRPRVRRAPRPVSQQLMRLALAECLQRSGEVHPRIVHHAVAMARQLGLSKAEQGFLNGVLRAILRDGGTGRAFPLEQTHPEWLVRRWMGQFGVPQTVQLLAWNQAPPDLMLRAEACPGYAEPTKWSGYVKLQPGAFREALPDLDAGTVYIQDPFARIPVELLDPRPGETVLDLCAAPGGKTRLIAGRMAGRGRLLAVDKPGRRLDRLRENAARMAMEGIEVIGSRVEDLGNLGLQPAGLLLADAVLIDVPCSNTGVIRKRPDVKLRLSEQDILQLRERQMRLLGEAARWTAPGGRLVYSTCSLEREENEDVVEAFCRSQPGWRLARAMPSRPWECGHDGGGAFLLTKDRTH